MSGSMVVVAGIVVVAMLAVVPWMLADFVLDRFGAFGDWWQRDRRDDSV